MNDKQLFENWRKFLAEENYYDLGYPEEEQFRKMVQQASMESELDRDFAAPRACLTLSMILTYLEDFREADAKTGEQIAFWKKKEAAADIGSSLLGAFIMGVLTAGKSVVIQGGMTLGSIILSYTYQKNHDFWVNPPTGDELANSEFLDKLDIHPIYASALGKSNIEPLREKWQKVVEANVEELIETRGDICLEDLDTAIANVIPDINVFIRDEMNLCDPEEAYKSGGEHGTDRFKGFGPVTEFHDNWRNFLLTEEKL